MQTGKFYFDITDLLEWARFNSTLSGIQRVSLRIIGNLIDQHGVERVDLIAFHPILRRIIEIDASFLSANYAFEQRDFCQHCGLYNVDIKTYLKGKYPTSSKRRFHRWRLKLLNYATGGRTYSKRGLGNISPAHGLRKESLRRNDIVVLLGATWDFQSFIHFLNHRKKQVRFEVVAFIHDLIPLMTPEHVGDNVPEKFQEWLLSIANIADKFMVNSQHTRNDLISFFELHNICNRDVTVIPLAHEFISDVPNIEVNGVGFVHEHRNRMRINASLLNATHQPYVLAVGTIESRKNLWGLLNVWKALLEDIGPSIPGLILAGKLGWGRNDLDNFMRGTGNLHGYIRICERQKDFELAYLYKRCLFTVFPSFYEGWGLPIGESLWFGKFVVASNHSSIPEVGKEMADYFNPYSHKSMFDAIKKLLIDDLYLSKRPKDINIGKLRTWKIVANDMWDALGSQNETQPLLNDSDPLVQIDVLKPDQKEATLWSPP